MPTLPCMMDGSSIQMLFPRLHPWEPCIVRFDELECGFLLEYTLFRSANAFLHDGWFIHAKPSLMALPIRGIYLYIIFLWDTCRKHYFYWSCQTVQRLGVFTQNFVGSTSLNAPYSWSELFLEMVGHSQFGPQNFVVIFVGP